MAEEKRRKPKKNRNAGQTEPPARDGMSTQERAYLEKLERLIASPGRTPYVDRRGKGSPPSQPPAPEPLFDSGPQTPDQLSQSGHRARSDHATRGRTRPSLETEDGRVRRGADGVYQIEIDVPAADLERFEQQRPSAVQPKQPAAKKPSPRRPQPEASSHEAPARTVDMFPAGTLVLWDENRLAIYKKHIPQKGYDLLYVVERGGQLQPKGLCLHAYEPRRVGLLSEAIVHWMEKTMRWERDALACHFENPAEVSKVAVLEEAPSTAQPQPAVAEEPDKTPNGQPFVRGRTFTVRMGDRCWHGVYWARDQIGTVVAHNTNHVWTLMHLDLTRFGSGIQLGDVLPEPQIFEIEKATNGQQ